MRPATPDDLPGVAAVFSHYVLQTTSTFATSLRTPAQWRERFDAKITNGSHRMLVAHRHGQFAGYVETSQFRPQDSYASAIETSIYVAPDQSGHGVGTALYTNLFAALDADANLHRAYAVIALPNPGSVAIHERFGFERRGVLTQAGRKFNKWIDVAYYERPLGPSSDPGGSHDQHLPSTTSQEPA